MDNVAHHVHVGGVYLITFGATLYVWNFLVRLFTAHHADNPIARGASIGF